MRRLIFVPQLPIKLRYSEWWIIDFKKEFQKYFEVIVLGEDYINNNSFISNCKDFSIFDKSIEFEQYQINQFLNLKLKNDDILFLSDISFPGFFSSVLHHKRVENAYAFCHGTSRNSYDYFQSVRGSKWLVETGHSKLFKKIFVATEYHKNKLRWDNIEVIGVPKPPFENFVSSSKLLNIISVARDNIQKRNIRLEKRVEKRFGEIIRANFNSWDDYYKFISQSKVMLITSKEETFGYQVMDAILNSCIPLAPNKFSYPELLCRKYLYSDEKELFDKIEFYLNYQDQYPSGLLNQSIIDSFYRNFITRIIDY